MKFNIEFSDRARDNLLALRKREQQIIVDSVEIHLTIEPDKPTRNRKRLQENRLAPWELRTGDFRAFLRRGPGRGDSHYRGNRAEDP